METLNDFSLAAQFFDELTMMNGRFSLFTNTASHVHSVQIRIKTEYTDAMKL